MTVSEFRQQVLHSPKLPALSALARAALNPSLSSSRLQEVVAEELPRNAKLSRAITLAARDHGLRAQDTADAARQVAASTLRKLLLNVSLSELLSSFPLQRLDQHTTIAHARTAAEIADTLAAPDDTSLALHAYAAGFLIDIGRLVLDVLTPDGYTGVLDFRLDGVHLLDAEQREFGIDHTLVGKWLAERWQLPEAILEDVWLHHLPPGLLDDTGYPVEFIDTVALPAQAAACAAANDAALSGLSFAAIERRRRIGLSIEALRSAVQAALKPIPPLEPQLEISEANLPLPGPPASLQRECARLRSWRTCLLSLARQHEPSSILATVAESIRMAFEVPAGICYAQAGTAIVGHIWRSLDTPLHPLHIDHASERSALATLLAVFTDSAAPDAPATLASLKQHQGLIAVPFVFEGNIVGQFIADAGHAGANWNASDLEEILHFSAAAANALARVDAREKQRGETEALANALARQELAHQQRARGERQAAIANLASGISHELIAPVTAIKSRAQQMLQGAQHEAATGEAILGYARRVERLLSDLTQVARPQEMHTEEIALAPLLHGLAASQRERLEQRSIVLYEEYADSLPKVRGDHRQLEQAFMVLLQNAEQAMDGGGILTLRARASGNRRSIVLQVSDTGAGVRAEAMNQIFEPFYSTRKRDGASGLGLSICRAIIEGHRGSVSVHSEPGSGATFIVTLPVEADAAPDQPELPIQHQAPLPPLEVSPTPQNISPDPAARDIYPAVPPASAAVTGVKARVLLIEENEDLREVLKASLESRGYLIDAAASAEEALSQLRLRVPDLLLVDLNTPAPPHAPLITQIHQRAPQVPLIALAGVASDDAAEEAVELGATACLRKPLEMQALLHAMETAQQRRSVA